MRLINEWRALWTLAGPLIVSQLCYTGMGAVDTLVAGRSGLYDLAGVAVGAGLWIPGALFLSGLAYAVTPLVAKGKGANQDARDSARWIAQTLYLMGLFGILAAAALWTLAPRALAAFGADPETLKAGSAYLYGMGFGALAFCWYQGLRSALIGLGQTGLEMRIALTMLIMNWPISAALVFGWGPLPELGAFGIGLGTAIVFWCGCIAIGIGLFRNHPHARPRRAEWAFEHSRILSIYRLGWPIGMAIFIEASVFSIISLLLAPMGALNVAAHSIALNLSALFFMVPLGVGLATTGRVGYLRGQGRFADAYYSAKAAIWLGLSIAAVSCVVTLIFRGTFASWYGADAEVTALATSLMIFAAIYQLPDAVQVIGSAAVRGYENSKGPMLVALVAYWVVCLPGGIWLGREGPAIGPAGFWIFLIIGLSLASIGMLWLLRGCLKLNR